MLLASCLVPLLPHRNRDLNFGGLIFNVQLCAIAHVFLQVMRSRGARCMQVTQREERRQAERRDRLR